MYLFLIYNFEFWICFGFRASDLFTWIPAGVYPREYGGRNDKKAKA
jgi:hypothetical protein